MRSLLVNSAAVTRRNRNILKTHSHLYSTTAQGANANIVVQVISTRNRQICTVTALTGKRFGSRANTQPNIVATKVNSAHGNAAPTPPKTRRCGFMNETQDHTMTPTNGRCSTIGSSTSSSRNSAADRTFHLTIG